MNGRVIFFALAICAATACVANCPPLFQSSVATGFFSKTIDRSSWVAVRTKPLPIRSLDSVEIIATAPSTEAEFRNAFGDQILTTSVLRKIESLRERYNKKVTFLSSEKQGTAEVARSLATSGARVVIVVGHIEHGSMRFPNGDAIEVRRMIGASTEPGKLLIVIGCDTAKEVPFVEGAIKGRISLERALAVAEGIRSRIAAQLERGSDITPLSILGDPAPARDDVVYLPLMDTWLHAKLAVSYIADKSGSMVVELEVVSVCSRSDNGYNCGG